MPWRFADTPTPPLPHMDNVIDTELKALAEIGECLHAVEIILLCVLFVYFIDRLLSWMYRCGCCRPAHARDEAATAYQRGGE